VKSVVKPLLTYSIPFSPDHPADYFAQFPASPAVFLLRGADSAAEPYVSKTANLRRRLLRLLSPPESQSRRLNLRERVVKIEYALTGSDFESGLLLYKLLRQEFPKSYQKRLRLHASPLIKLNLENEYPRAYVTNKLGRLTGKSVYYGPFRSRAVAEKFLNDSLDLYKMRRCTFDLNPDPKYPGCVYSEMKMCLAPCFKGCTDEAYMQEVARVEAYLDSGGTSLLSELEVERDRLSAALEFEAAAQQHAKTVKVKGILSICDEICRRLDRLGAVIIQPASPAHPEQVALFRFHQGELAGPYIFTVEAASEAPAAPTSEAENATDEERAPGAGAKPETPSLESRVRAALAEFVPDGARNAAQFSEELAILKRWYYRTHKIGEIILANDVGELSARKIANAIHRVSKGEKSAAPTPEFDRDQP
jgi:excinuclease ABC subunit C